MAASDGFSSELARELASDALERFLRYVRVDTQSRLESETVPSTPTQLDLSSMLAEELRELGLEDVDLTEAGHVLATLPTTVEGAPTIGLLAHVDTSPDTSGANVEPVLHRDYDGGDLVLPGDPERVLSPREFPELALHAGHDLVTSDGTTLLGADDKAGVAEIVAAVGYLARHPELPRCGIRVAFTTDEEIGEGVRGFDVAGFGAVAAYTLDGSTAGEIEDETFSAEQVKVTYRGVNAHTGTAKGILVSAVKLAAALVARLPPELAPETTEGREGFLHPLRIEGTTARATVTFIARDHDAAKLERHVELLRRLAEQVAAAEPRARLELERKVQYRNMKDFLGADSPVVRAAELAVRRAGLEPRRTIVRGGTDGARLTEMGLPTPNVFTGGHQYHSELEWLCVQDMGAAAATAVHLAEIWADGGPS